jgi:hypothetical protein
MTTDQKVTLRHCFATALLEQGVDLPDHVQGTRRPRGGCFTVCRPPPRVYASPSSSCSGGPTSSMSSVGSRARASGGDSVATPRCARMRWMCSRSVMTARTQSRPWHRGLHHVDVERAAEQVGLFCDFQTPVPLKYFSMPNRSRSPSPWPTACATSRAISRCTGRVNPTSSCRATLSAPSLSASASVKSGLP